MAISATNPLAAGAPLGVVLGGADYCGDALKRLNEINIELTNIFSDAGFSPIEPAILQPADPLFDLYGEEIWERAFVVDEGPDGALCLRPDFTVPVARSHLARAAQAGLAPEPARYGYFGPVFRRAAASRGASMQHLQAGVEIIGEPDAVARDAEVFDLCRKALEWAGCRTGRTVTGDLSIAFAMLESLSMPESWRRRLKRHFWRPERFHQLLRGFADDAPASAAGRMAFLKGFGGLAPKEAQAALAEMMALSDVPQIGARSAQEVAARFLRQAADAREHPLSTEVVALIEAVLAVKAPSAQALKRLKDLASGAGLDLRARLEAMERRLEALSRRGIDAGALPFDAAFGRNLEYYDGFVFEISAPSREELGREAAGHVDANAERGSLILGGGGRYDRLFRAMGAPAGLTGVGAALRPEAILAAADAAGGDARAEP